MDARLRRDEDRLNYGGGSGTHSGTGIEPPLLF
jgi:hypothetical protein